MCFDKDKPCPYWFECRPALPSTLSEITSNFQISTSCLSKLYNLLLESKHQYNKKKYHSPLLTSAFRPRRHHIQSHVASVILGVNDVIVDNGGDKIEQAPMFKLLSQLINMNGFAVGSHALLEQAEQSLITIEQRIKELAWDWRSTYFIWDFAYHDCLTFHVIVSCSTEFPSDANDLEKQMSLDYHHEIQQSGRFDRVLITPPTDVQWRHDPTVYYIGTVKLLKQDIVALSLNKTYNHCEVNTSLHDLLTEDLRTILTTTTKIYEQLYYDDYTSTGNIEAPMEIEQRQNSYLQYKFQYPNLFMPDNHHLINHQYQELLSFVNNPQNELVDRQRLLATTLRHLFFEKKDTISNQLIHYHSKMLHTNKNSLSILGHFYLDGHVNCLTSLLDEKIFDIKDFSLEILRPDMTFTGFNQYLTNQTSESSIFCKNTLNVSLNIEMIFKPLQYGYHALSTLFPLLPIKEARQYMSEQLKQIHYVWLDLSMKQTLKLLHDTRSNDVSLHLYNESKRLIFNNQWQIKADQDKFNWWVVVYTDLPNPHVIYHQNYINFKLIQNKFNQRKYNDMMFIQTYWDCTKPNEPINQKPRPLLHIMYWLMQHMVSKTNNYQIKQEMIVFKKFIKWMGRNQNMEFNFPDMESNTTWSLPLYEMMTIWQSVVQNLCSTLRIYNKSVV